MRGLALVVLLFLLWAPSAYAWSWPAQGPVLLGFTFDPAHPYAGGQHRGIDVGAPTGTPVAAPVSGTISFAGTVPTSGRSVTIETGDGYSVTLTHLGSIGVSKGASVGEGSIVGTVGPSGTPELDVPYVSMGVRVTANAQGYLDPLSFLPALPPPVGVSAPAPPPPTPAPVADPPQTTTASDTTSSDTTTDATDPTEPPVSDATVDAPAPPPEVTTTPASGAGDGSAPDTSGTTEPPASDAPTDAPAPPPQEATTEPASAAPDTTVPDGVPNDQPSQSHVAPPVPAPAPYATVINPDPGFDPTASTDPDSGSQAGQADPDTTPAAAADPAPIAADDAFATHALFPAATFAVPAAAVAAARPDRVPIVRAVAPIVPRPVPPAPPVAPTATRHPLHARTRGPGRRGVAPGARPAAHVTVPARHGRTLWPLFVLLALACAAALKAVRMISSSSTTSEGAHPVAVAEDPRRGRMAVRERTAAPGPCRRPRRAVRHLRPLSPPQGQRRPHGERDRRARHAGDGVGGSRRRVAS